MILFLLFLLAGCFAMPAEAPAPPLVVTVPEVSPPRTIIPAHGDVLRTSIISVQDVPVREERLVFGTPGLTVRGIYVSVGDWVAEGDIIAELELPYIQTRLDAALREREWLMLDLSQLQARHEHRLWEAAQSGMPVDDVSYITQQELILSRLNGIDIRIDYLQSRNDMRYLRTTMDGIVTTVLHFQEGMQSDALRTVATVTDQSQMIFRAQAPEPGLMRVGDYFEIYIDQVPYLAQVVDVEPLGLSEIVFLEVVGENQPELTATTRSWIYLILEEARDVLFIPRSALRQTAARAFVYVLEDGVRVLRDVEIGVVGNNTVEIVSGLSGGELVLNE